MQSAADSEKVPAKISWEAINRAGRNYGAPTINAESFAIEYEQNPVLKSLVTSYDETGITLSTTASAPLANDDNKSTQKRAMSAAAKKAAKRAIKK